MEAKYLDNAKVAKVYSRYSGCYDYIFGTFFNRSRAAAIDLLSLKSGDRVLEVGVGTGLALSLYPRDCRVVGIDLTSRMLERGARRVQKYGLDHVHLQQQDAQRLAFRDNSFDAVMAAYVISAVPDPKAVLAEMSRVCRPNGVIVILNHFSNGNPVVSGFERFVSPMCKWVGFRSYLTLESVLQETCLAVEYSFRVDPFQYWYVVQCINRKPEFGFA